MFRVAIMKKHNLSSFELSQAYLFFWDKLEKANWFLEQIIETAEEGEELDGRLVQRLLEGPVSDGGQWDMLANLVEKYGLVCLSLLFCSPRAHLHIYRNGADADTLFGIQVPQSLYPDSMAAQRSQYMDGIITAKLREDALILRSLCTSHSKNTLNTTKSHMLKEIHRILTLMLGPPPSPHAPFTWEYLDSSSTYHRVSLTPLQLAQELSSPAVTRCLAGADVNALFSLVHDPRHEPLTFLTVSRLGNVVGGRAVSYVNVSMQTLKAAAIRMLKAGLPVFFGCDVGKFSDSKTGIMDEKMFDYENVFDVELGMDKEARVRSGASAVTHAMVLTGVQVEGEKGEEMRSVRWRVQNSWGGEAGTKGYWVMSDGWMDEYVFQVVVDPGFVGKEVRDVWEGRGKGKGAKVVLPLWDPLGALA